MVTGHHDNLHTHTQLPIRCDNVRLYSFMLCQEKYVTPNQRGLKCTGNTVFEEILYYGEIRQNCKTSPGEGENLQDCLANGAASVTVGDMQLHKTYFLKG